MSSCLSETVRKEEGTEIARGLLTEKKKENTQLHKDGHGQGESDNGGVKYSLLRYIPTFLYSFFFPICFSLQPLIQYSSTATFCTAVSQSYSPITLSLFILSSTYCSQNSTSSTFQMKFQHHFQCQDHLMISYKSTTHFY